jgi:hypothetical protein
LPWREAHQIADKREVRTPGQLNQLAAPLGKTFSEVCRVDRVLLYDLARFQLDFPKS